MAEEVVPQPAPKFEQKMLEADIDRLAGEIMKHKETLDREGADQKEILKQAIRSIQSSKTDDSAAPAPAPSANPAYIPQYAAGASPEVKLEIEYLVDLALREGIAKANSVAAKSNPFIMDAFHDVLAGQLYPELQRRKII